MTIIVAIKINAMVNGSREYPAPLRQLMLCSDDSGHIALTEQSEIALRETVWRELSQEAKSDDIQTSAVYSRQQDEYGPSDVIWVEAVIKSSEVQDPSEMLRHIQNMAQGPLLSALRQSLLQIIISSAGMYLPPLTFQFRGYVRKVAPVVV